MKKKKGEKETEAKQQIQMHKNEMPSKVLN